MLRLAVLLCLSMLAWGCGSDSRVLPPRGTSVTAPSPPPPPAPPPTPPQGPPQISVGQEVTGRLTAHGTEDVFELTAPSDGTVVADLKWDPERGRLELWLAGKQFLSSEAGGSIVATLPVAAGRKYRVEVVDGIPWDYDDLSLLYVLKTSMQ